MSTTRAPLHLQAGQILRRNDDVLGAILLVSDLSARVRWMDGQMASIPLNVCLTLACPGRFCKVFEGEHKTAPTVYLHKKDGTWTLVDQNRAFNFANRINWGPGTKGALEDGPVKQLAAMMLSSVFGSLSVVLPLVDTFASEVVQNLGYPRFWRTELEIRAWAEEAMREIPAQMVGASDL